MATKVDINKVKYYKSRFPLTVIMKGLKKGSRLLISRLIYWGLPIFMKRSIGPASGVWMLQKILNTTLFKSLGDLNFQYCFHSLLILHIILLSNHRLTLLPMCKSSTSEMSNLSTNQNMMMDIDYLLLLIHWNS